MIASDRCFRLIRDSEDLRRVAYKPTPDDVWTIGYGHTKGVKEGDTCTESQADQWLIEDTQFAVDCVNEQVTVALNQNQFDALVDFVFNVGVGQHEHESEPGTGFEGSTLLRKLNEGDYAGAAAEFPKWCHQNGKKLAGLVTRRAKEKALFEEPVHVDT